MDSNSQSHGICQRLISFFLHKLRRPAALPGSTRVPIEDGSSLKPVNQPNVAADSEIVVYFRHTDEHVNSGLGPRKDGLIVSSDHTRLQHGLDREGIQETEAHPARGKGPKKTVAIKKEEANQSGGADHQATMANNHHPHDETIPVRPHWPLRTVTSNIDKKSDEYIESRKKAMGRNYSLDPEKS